MLQYSAPRKKIAKINYTNKISKIVLREEIQDNSGGAELLNWSNITFINSHVSEITCAIWNCYDITQSPLINTTVTVSCAVINNKCTHYCVCKQIQTQEKIYIHLTDVEKFWLQYLNCGTLCCHFNINFIKVPFFTSTYVSFVRTSPTFLPAELSSYLPKFISRTNTCGISTGGRESDETIPSILDSLVM